MRKLLNLCLLLTLLIASLSNIVGVTYADNLAQPVDCTPRTDWPTYTVIESDSIDNIASLAGITVDELVTANCLASAAVFTGQVLYVPVSLDPPACIPRTDWPTYTVVETDTLTNIASRAGSTVDELVTANCLESTTIFSGQVLQVPNPIEPVCVPRTDWPTYVVQAGDTLTSLASSAGTTVDDLVSGNCLVDTNLFVGQVLRVPDDIVPAPLPNITITNITNGQVLNIDGLVHITGTGTALFEGALVVQARDNLGNVITEQPTIATGSALGGTGPWEVNLSIPNAARGISGDIYAFSTSAMDGSVVAQASINVVFGEMTVTPLVDITTPYPNTTVNIDGPVRITGVGRSLFEGNVVVQALDASGRLLAQQATTLFNMSAGGFGSWQVDLPINTQRGTRGTIFAFSTSPADGHIIASDSVSINYGGTCYIRTDWPTYRVQPGDTLFKVAQRTSSSVTELATANCLVNANTIFVGQILYVPRLPAPLPTAFPLLEITSPRSGEMLTSSVPVRVMGSGRDLSGNSIIVQALDTNGNVLVQQMTTIATPRQGTWQADLMVNVEPGTRGGIYAFATSGPNNVIIADAFVNTTFGTPVPSEGASVIITTPEDASSTNASGTLAVTGTASGLTDNRVMVRILDNNGNMLAGDIAPVNVVGDTPNTWQLNTPLDVQDGTRGKIFAYAISPIDGLLVAMDAVNVLFGSDNGGPFVTIDTPLPYETLDLSQPIVITGQGRGLFEGNVVVRALDDNGNILAEEPTTLQAAEVGGQGTWEIDLNINAAEGTRGRIYVFSTSPQDGSVIAAASVKVIYGNPDLRDRFVTIHTPLPDTLLGQVNSLTVTGRGGGLFEGSVTVQILGENGDVLASQAAEVSAGEENAPGIWETTLTINDLPASSVLRIYAFTTSPSDGSVIASDSVDVIYRPAVG